MSTFRSQVITKKGEELVARALAQGGSIHWTKASIGDGVPGVEMTGLETLVSPKLDAILIDSENLGAVSEIILKFSNENITEEFEVKELGIFGQLEGDTESVLYSYSTAIDYSVVPINSNPFELQWSLYTQVTDGEKLDIKIKPVLQMLNKETADKLYEQIFAKKTAHNKDFGTGSDEVPRGNHVHSFDETTGCSIRIKQLFITEDTENPALTWPGTTWSKIEGRVLLGTSSGYALGVEGGTATVTLTKANLPNVKLKTDSHLHTKSPHTHTITGGYGTGNLLSKPRVSSDNTQYTRYTGAAGGENTGAAAPMTEALGNGESFNIMNPYRAVNIWRRES